MEIDALWFTLHSYFAWTSAFDTRLIRWNVVILGLTASAAFGKQNPKQNIILSNSTFYNLSVDI